MTTEREIHEQLARTLRARADLVADAPPLTEVRSARIRRTRARRVGVLIAVGVLGFGIAAFAAVRPATNNARITTSPVASDAAPATDLALSHDPDSPHSA